MRRRLIYFIAFLFTTKFVFGQRPDITSKIDSIISAQTSKPFNGTILISQNGQVKYSKTVGYSDLENKISLKQNDQYVIGSISKQITAVLVLQEFEMGRLKLDIPIRNYLPELTQSWADTITVHQLLTHTHGIRQLDKPLAFIPGTQFQYSQIGYHLLAAIIEKTSKKSFSTLSTELFEKCNMKKTFDPNLQKHKNLVKGYTDGKRTDENESLQNFVAAGSFISTANDLILWNENLFGGKLLSSETLKLMESKQKGATRQHPIFGATDYGYGITIDTKENILQFGQTGFAPGFVSMNFYFPDSKTSIIILANVVYDTDDIAKTFRDQTEILKALRASDLITKNYN